MGVCLHACLCSLRMPHAFREQKSVLGSLELEL